MHLPKKRAVPECRENPLYLKSPAREPSPPVDLLLAAARSALDRSSGSYRLPRPCLRYKPKSEGGSRCYRTPREKQAA
jgi:hypothetical protein